VDYYSLFTNPVIWAAVAQTGIDEVQGDGFGVAETAPRVWRAGELVDDYVRLLDGDGVANYGYVDDILVNDGQIEAVVVRPDVTWGAPGLYAYPYYGYGYGWYPGSIYYDLPYDRTEVKDLKPLEEDGSNVG
jgi:hypothetical protein